MPTDPQWHIVQTVNPPEWLLAAIQRLAPDLSGHYIAQLLWQRGVHDGQQVTGFLDPNHYQPTSPDVFGAEMHKAIQRLKTACDRNQKVAIWGDFDADGITSTAVLWDGLGQFFSQNHSLTYTIPNRITESHGLHCSGLERLAAQGYQLIVTCDTGSTNLTELEYAQALGLDVIVTDHHTLPPERPPVTAIINPRYFPTDHPLAHLSGVAVAYKLVEALYLALPDVPEQPLEHLLDLVAIGLIADLVALKGDCRYLAQRGIEQLQQQLTRRTRPGVAKLLELCKRNGDRPTDISFGLGPRINAVSRIHGDASFCVELLTSTDPIRCQQLAEETELANTRRKSLQKDVLKQVTRKLDKLDLSTTAVIVLSDPQWPIGVLGLVAGQIAQTYGRPTILLCEETVAQPGGVTLARGSARSVNQIDLYTLVQSQAGLLKSFGGHPFAAGLSLPVTNIPLLVEAINQQARQQQAIAMTTVVADLELTLAELAKEGGKCLFKELKLLEPCGMGNPVPKLLIRDCWFDQVWNANIRDRNGNKVQYIKTTFDICDVSMDAGFPGLWWGHYKDEIPVGHCDAIVELDFNAYKKRYEVRLIALRPATTTLTKQRSANPGIVDWRQGKQEAASKDVLVMADHPESWAELQNWVRQAQAASKTLAVAYDAADPPDEAEVWKQWVGIAKFLARTGEAVSLSQLQSLLNIGPVALQTGLQSLQVFGFKVQCWHDVLQVEVQPSYKDCDPADRQQAIQHFFDAVREEQFQRQYFQEVSVDVMGAMANHQSMFQEETMPTAMASLKPNDVT